MNISEAFWDASLDEIIKGYVYDAQKEQYTCLVCGEKFEKGIVYRQEESFYEAEKYAKLHIGKEHASMFEYLLNMDKKFTGLTELQKKLLELFYNGYSDAEVMNCLEAGSTSTIRNHRFMLREKSKQAKVFLAIMELLDKNSSANKKLVSVHRTATMVDERYAMTEKENEQILRSYFDKGLDGPLKDFPKKEKRKIAVLREIIKRFEIGRKYTEKEVNEILKSVHPDFATIRRYLIEYGFMDRHKDGSLYWVKV